MEYEFLKSIKTTKKDLSLNYYFDRKLLQEYVSSDNSENLYPPYIDHLKDLSYIEFAANDNYSALNCNNNSIINIGNIDISLNIYKYIKFIFNRQLIIKNLQFKNNNIGDVSFILWRRFPLLENMYSDISSSYAKYVIDGDGTASNIKTIYNINGLQSYDFIFEFVPNQSIPKYIYFDTYATNDIFYIDSSNLDISGLNNNIGDPSFILWYTNDRSDCSSIYINPTTFRQKFIKDISNFEINLVDNTDEHIIGISLEEAKSYTIDSSNISIEQLNLLLRDLSGDLINDAQFDGDLLQINNNYPNFSLSLTNNYDNSNISIRHDSKLLNYLGIYKDISYIDITNFEFIPKNQAKTEIFASKYQGSLNIDNDNIFTKIDDIDIYEKRPIYDGCFNDISNNQPKNHIILINENLNEVIIEYELNENLNKKLITYTNKNITLDISNVNTKILNYANLKFNNITPTDISLISVSGNIDEINIGDLLFNDNSTFTINDICINNLNITERMDVSYSFIENLECGSIITNNLLLNNNKTDIYSNDINKSYINFIDTEYHYLRFDFDNTTDLSINSLKIYDFNNTDISFTVREPPYSSNNYEISNNNFSANFTKNNKTIILDFNEPIFIHKISYKRNEIIFDIQENLNDTIIYCIDESYIPNQDDININEFIFKIVIPPGRWTIAEINALLAETNGNNYSLDNNVNVYAFHVNNTLDDISANRNVSLNLSGLKPRNTHFNRYLPFTAAYINNRPVLITAFNYQIHDISGYRQPSDIYTFYKNSTFLEYFFEPNYLVPYDTSNNDISGIIPDNFYSNKYHWDIPSSYNTFKKFGYNVISHQHRSDNDISTNSYQNILFNFKLPKMNIYGISKYTENLDMSYDTIIQSDIPYDYNTFIYDHYRPVNSDGTFIDYSTNIVDLSNGLTHYDICENCIPLIDSSINENIHYKKLYLEDSSFTQLLVNDNKFIFINLKKNFVKLNIDNSYNCLLDYDISSSTLVFHTDLLSYTAIYIAPLESTNYEFTSEVTITADYLYAETIEAGTILNISDDRQKFNEKDLSNCIDIVNKIKPYKYYKTSTPYTHEYHFNVNNLPIGTKIESGYIAQDISAIPELNHLVNKTDNLLNLNYNGIQPYLTSALKDLNSKINQNEILIQQLREKINTLKNK